MPFAVFRQHQRKLLAVFALLAMIGFVLGDTLPRWINGGGVSGRDSVVADLFNTPVRLSDLARMNEQRQRASRFLAYANLNPALFGGTTRAELLDAMILKHEADRLGIPETSEFARKWIESQPFSSMTPQLFELILSKFDNKIGGEQLLIDVAAQARIALAREVIAMPVVTPLDVFRNYRDQTERCSFKVVPFLVDSFVDKLPDPTEAEARDLFEKYKDALPDPASPTPGFKVPRKVKVEFLSLDANDRARSVKASLPEADIKSYYETKKVAFPLDIGLPPDLFLGEPKLTPPRYQPYADLRDGLADALARERADDQIQDTFGAIRDEVIDKFADRYKEAQDEISDARKEGRPTDAIVVPKPDDLAVVAKKFGLNHEVTPLLDRHEAEQYGRISRARSGAGRAADARDFAAVAFDAKTTVFDGFELGDILGDRYLARKIVDEPAHVATLAEVRDQVVRAWKVEKARPLARKAAEEYAAKLKAEGGTIQTLAVDGRPVVAIDAATKLKPGVPVPSRFAGQFRYERGPASPTDLPQIPGAGPALIDALFALKPGQVAVAADRPQTTYYALTLDKRDPVSFLSLMGPSGALAGYWSETQTEVGRKSYADGMARLREQAHLVNTVLAPEGEPRDDGDHAE